MLVPGSHFADRMMHEVFAVPYEEAADGDAPPRNGSTPAAAGGAGGGGSAAASGGADRWRNRRASERQPDGRLAVKYDDVYYQLWKNTMMYVAPSETPTERLVAHDSVLIYSFAGAAAASGCDRVLVQGGNPYATRHDSIE